MPSIDSIPSPDTVNVGGRLRVRVRFGSDGRRWIVYLGKPGADEVVPNYLRALGLWQANGYRWSDAVHEAYKAGEDVPRTGSLAASADGPVLAAIAAKYLTWSRANYVKGGVQTSTYGLDRAAVQELLNTPGLATTPAAGAGAGELSAFRDRLESLTRQTGTGDDAETVSHFTAQTVNRYLGRARYMLRWARSEGLIPGDADETMPSRPGRTPKLGGATIRSNTKRGPAPRASVLAVRRRLRAGDHPPVAAMIALQLRSSMRPAEVCMMRPDLIVATETPGVRVYVPDAAADKIARAGEVAVPVLLGPRCMRALRPWLDDARARGARYVFDPTPYAKRKSRILDHYTPARYAFLLREACRAAGVEHFTPYQLRHSGATRLERRADTSLDDIMRQLRHTQARTTLGYIDPSIDARIAFASAHC